MTPSFLTKTLAASALALVCVSAAQAHQVRFEGGIGSGAAVLTEGMITYRTDFGIVNYSATSENEATISREDETNQISCIKAYSAYSCRVSMKHGRPLEDLDSYPVGNNMTLEGAAKSNADMIAKIIEARALSDKSVVLKDSSPYVFATRKSDDLLLSCRNEPGNASGTSSCDLTTKSVPAKN